MTDTIKKGTVLWAIDPCVMSDTGKQTLTLGKSYKVIDIAWNEFIIVDDEGEYHKFDIDGKYFSLTPPEDPLAKSLQLLDEHLTETPREEIERDLQEIEDKFKAGDGDKGEQIEGKSDVPIMVNDIIERMEAHVLKTKLDILGIQHQMKDPMEDQAAGNELLKRHQQEIDGFEWCMAVLKAHKKGEK